MWESIYYSWVSINYKTMSRYTRFILFSISAYSQLEFRTVLCGDGGGGGVGFFSFERHFQSPTNL